MTRWPAAVAVSVLAHVAVAGGLFVSLGRSSTTLPSAAPHARAIEVMRIGVLPRAAHSPEPVAAPEPPARAGRVATAAPRPLTFDTPAPSQVALAAPGPEGAEASDAPAPSHVALAAPGPVTVEAPDSHASLFKGTQPRAVPDGSGLVEGATGTALPSPGAHAGTAATDDARGDTVDLAFTRELHARLAAAAAECYPPQARRFRQQARVPVSFCIDADGQPERVVVTPSGIASLDEAASSCVVRRAAPFPSRARAHCFTVPIDFGARGG
ncbi:MAG: TonB family protein [Myxococcales bacterium]|nr:TonB family protein [Myxococcales bacterium]